MVAVHTFFFISSLLIPKLLGQHGPGELCAVPGAALEGVDQLERVRGALRMLSNPESINYEDNISYELTQNYLR